MIANLKDVWSYTYRVTVQGKTRQEAEERIRKRLSIALKHPALPGTIRKQPNK